MSPGQAAVAVPVGTAGLFLLFTPLFYAVIAQDLSRGWEGSWVVYLGLRGLRLLLALVLWRGIRRRVVLAGEPRGGRGFAAALGCALVYALLCWQGTVWRLYMTVAALPALRYPESIPLPAAVLLEQLLDGRLLGCVLLGLVVVLAPKLRRPLTA